MQQSSTTDAHHRSTLGIPRQDTTNTARAKIEGIPRRRSGLISDDEIRTGKLCSVLQPHIADPYCIALNARNAVAPSNIIKRSLSSGRISLQLPLEASRSATDNDGNMSHSYNRLQFPSTQDEERTSGEGDRREQTTHNEVEEGYVDVPRHTRDETTARQYRSSERRQVSASTSATSGTSSHLVHTREPTVEPSWDPNLSPSRRNRIQHLESETEWLYQRNAELQDEVDSMKSGYEVIEKEHRHRVKRMESSLNTVQVTLEKAERQNRSLEATIAQLRNPRQVESRAPSGMGVPLMPIQQYRAMQLSGLGIRPEGVAIPASTSMTDSMAISVSGSSQGGHSRTSSLEGTFGEAPVNQEYQRGHGELHDRRVRKKVSWQDEVDPRTVPRPLAPIRVAGANAVTTSILKTSPTKTQHDFNLPGCPSSPSSNLSPPLPNISGWFRSQSSAGQAWQGHRRASDTSTLAPGRSLYEEMGESALQPSVSQVSSTFGFPTWRRDASSAQLIETEREELASRRADIDETSNTDNLSRTGADRGDPQNASVLEHCKAVLEDRGSDFWQQIQFWCVVGIFVSGVLSKGRDGVLELGKRR